VSAGCRRPQLLNALDRCEVGFTTVVCAPSCRNRSAAAWISGRSAATRRSSPSCAHTAASSSPLPDDAPVTIASGLLMGLLIQHLNRQSPHVNRVVPETVRQGGRIGAPPRPLECVRHDFHHHDVVVFGATVGRGPDTLEGERSYAVRPSNLAVNS